MKPRVLNKHSDFPGEEAVYIGRPSKWGNPYDSFGREENIRRFREYLTDKLMQDEAFLEPLRGKDLVCFCKPLNCHGDVIMEFLYGL